MAVMVNMRLFIERWLGGHPFLVVGRSMAEVLVRHAQEPNSAFFLIDGEYQSALSAMEDTPAEMPPLPFEYIFVDIDSERTLSYRMPDAEYGVDIHGFAIHELEQGRRWEVCALVFAIDRDREFMSFLSFDITSDGGVILKGEDGERINAGERGKFLRAWAIELVQLITAKNVQHVQATRQVTRQMRRALKVAHKPQSFTIRMMSSDARTGAAGSGREYSCRWIVRGHWRQYQSGKRTWVHSYIKGKPGAPWRNPAKPLYKVEPGLEVAHA